VEEEVKEGAEEEVTEEEWSRRTQRPAGGPAALSSTRLLKLE